MAERPKRKKALLNEEQKAAVAAVSQAAVAEAGRLAGLYKPLFLDVFSALQSRLQPVCARSYINGDVDLVDFRGETREGADFDCFLTFKGFEKTGAIRVTAKYPENGVSMVASLDIETHDTKPIFKFDKRASGEHDVQKAEDNEEEELSSEQLFERELAKAREMESQVALSAIAVPEFLRFVSEFAISWGVPITEEQS